jgi:hypothetical protein|tara:strand:- start:1232 stop:1714 length:483 start_codon:yes stop_codon:yes gene_type:complete
MPVDLKLNIKFPWFVSNVASKPLYLALVIIPIPIIGLVLELYSFQSSFSRSGSLLVCVAIFSIYINHFLSIAESNTKGMLQSVIKLGRTPEEILRNMNPAITGDTRNITASNMYLLLKAAEIEIPRLTDAKDKLVKVEFLAGVLGTFIWGFGDLIQCIIV